MSQIDAWDIQATVVITTRNRCRDVVRAVESCLKQDVPVEVIVVDDASEDDTSQVIRQRFPQVKVVRSETQIGLVGQRDVHFRQAKGPVVFSLDDDAEFTSPSVVRQILSQFDHPSIGVVNVPLVNVIEGKIVPLPVVPTAPSDGKAWISRAFFGGSHAVRRDVFVECGGLSGALIRWNEETDFAQRLMGHGYVIRIGQSDLVHHHPNMTGRHGHGRNVYLHRSSMLVAWWNTPLRYLPMAMGALTVRVLKELIGSRSSSAAWTTVWSYLRGLGACVRYANKRKPISLAAYRLYLELRHRKTMPLDEALAFFGAKPDATCGSLR